MTLQYKKYYTIYSKVNYHDELHAHKTKGRFRQLAVGNNDQGDKDYF